MDFPPVKGSLAIPSSSALAGSVYLTIPAHSQIVLQTLKSIAEVPQAQQTSDAFFVSFRSV